MHCLLIIIALAVSAAVRDLTRPDSKSLFESELQALVESLSYDWSAADQRDFEERTSKGKRLSVDSRQLESAPLVDASLPIKIPPMLPSLALTRRGRSPVPRARGNLGNFAGSKSVVTRLPRGRQPGPRLPGRGRRTA
eukprot:Blabericola_migrator_1__3473@NODE_2027_length_3390_cov_503_443274_g1288_i0_p3_GENE_NODE_2027_length_3390_cov_503_443274_g1288_i0NODE_2027_length_3390_cov_503_443274_g1288_i0_p3_ORF_typecomplete_len138_score16_01_NODE_2027_length_3390_cov_503_443274_g1288_i08321245